LARHRSLARGKRLLYSTLQRPLPAAVVRHPKQGFTLPFARWMRDGTLAPLVRGGMEQLAARGWITNGAAARVWADWQQGRTHWSRPWGLGLLGHVLESA
jgi:asparagine synthase (glutamine-hydrolysing)